MTNPILEKDPKLAEIVRRLVEAYQPERIYLFGSKARGEEGPDSDYDLLVVVPASELPGHRRDQQTYRVLRGIPAAKDMMVWTCDEFDVRAGVVCSYRPPCFEKGCCSMRPEVAQEVKEWLERAAENLREAEHNLAAAPPFLRDATLSHPISEVSQYSGTTPELVRIQNPVACLDHAKREIVAARSFDIPAKSVMEVCEPEAAK